MNKIRVGSIFIVGMVITTLIYLYFQDADSRRNAYTLAKNSEMAKKEVEHVVSSKVNAVFDVRAFMLATDTLPDFTVFDRFAKNVLIRDPAITGLAYVDAGRVIRHFYPLKGNEKAIGLDLMTRPAARFVEKAIRGRIITINNPTVTIQGKLSIVVRAPLFQNNKFKGLVQALMELKLLLNSVKHLSDQKIGYVFKDRYGKQFAKFGNPVAPFHTATVAIGDNYWSIESGWNTRAPSADPMVIILVWILGTIISVSASWLYHRRLLYTERLSRGVATKTLELEQAYENLRSKSKQYKSLIESSYAIPWEVDVASFTFTYVGKQAETILGYSLDQWEEPGFWLSKIHPDDQDKSMAYCQTEISLGRDHSLEYRMYAADGHIVWFRDDVIVITRDGVAETLQGFMFDVTSQKIAEEQLRQANDELEEKVMLRTRDLNDAKELAIKANNAKSHFLSRMSHELRTPMNAILGFAQLLDLEEELADSHKTSIGEILMAGKHLLVLINEVLELTHIESGDISIKLENFLLKPVLNEIVLLMKPIADKRKISIHVERNIEDSLVLESEETRLREVLLNLFSNAIKYNKENGSVTLKCDQVKEGKVRISIIDTGPGLDPEQQQKMFEPFNRLGAENSDIEGTGIGMSITKELLELLGSRLSVESEVGKGSSFYFDLSIKQDV